MLVEPEPVTPVLLLVLAVVLVAEDGLLPVSSEDGLLPVSSEDGLLPVSSNDAGSVDEPVPPPP